MGKHYVPQAYLRNFCVPGSETQIVVYDKEQDRFFQTNVKNVAQERDFYDDETEQQLATMVEDPAKPALQRLVGGKSLQPEDRWRLALYAAVLLKRVPSSRRRAEGYVPHTVNEVVGSVRAQIQELLERGEGKVGVLRQRLAELDGLEDKMIANPPAAMRAHMESPWPTGQMVEAIAAMKWRVVSSDGPQYFVTTDNPGFFFEAYGLASKESEFVLPLSTQVALVGNWSPQAPPLQFVGPIRQPLVRELNRRLVSASTRFVLSAREECWIEKLSHKRQHYLSRIKWT